MDTVLKHCPQLRLLDVSGCQEVSDRSLECAQEACALSDRPLLEFIVGGKFCLCLAATLIRVRQTLPGDALGCQLKVDLGIETPNSPPLGDAGHFFFKLGRSRSRENIFSCKLTYLSKKGLAMDLAPVSLLLALHCRHQFRE